MLNFYVETQKNICIFCHFPTPAWWCMVIGAHFANMELTLIPTGISNYIHYKVWDEIISPVPNFNDEAAEDWECSNDFIPHFTRHVITYSCRD